jgi:hypothetical protein
MPLTRMVNLRDFDHARVEECRYTAQIDGCVAITTLHGSCSRRTLTDLDEYGQFGEGLHG